MVRLALGFLAALFLLAFWVTSLPVPELGAAPAGVRLQGVTLSLYPDQDPTAVWRFTADSVVQDPATREARISQLKQGARYLDGKLDLTLSAPEVTIDREDNLGVPYATIYIPSVCWTLELGGPGQLAVQINQAQGYRAPTVKVTGPGIDIRARDLVSDFKLENPSWQVIRETYTTDGVQDCKGE